MSRIKNKLAGKTFGNWTVLSEADTRKCDAQGRRIGKKGITKWHCKCACGREKPAVLYTSLIRGESKSCGNCDSIPQVRTRSRSGSIDITGKTFGRWTILRRSERPNRWVAQCACGTVRDPKQAAILHGTSTSCGCYHKEQLRARAKNIGAAEHLRHAQHNTLYRIWQSMKTRCTNSKAPCYTKYGGRGISVHPEWLKDFTSFATHMGPRPSENHSLDRIDNNGNYIPGNARWATRVEQAENTRNNPEIEYDGEVIHLRDLADKLNISRSIFRYYYLLRGKSVEDTISAARSTKQKAIDWREQGKPSLPPKTSFIDYTNQVYGVWKVIRYEGRKGPTYPSKWLIRCMECGEEKITTAPSLNEGRFSNCRLTRKRAASLMANYPAPDWI